MPRPPDAAPGARAGWRGIRAARRSRASGNTSRGSRSRAAATRHDDPRADEPHPRTGRRRMSGSSSWSFREEDARRIQIILSAFLRESNARTALHRRSHRPDGRDGGRAAGVRPDRLRLAHGGRLQRQRPAGPHDRRAGVRRLFHQGETESMYLADVARRVILVVLFDNRTTLGLVKLRVRATVRGADRRSSTEMFSSRRQRNASRWNQGCWAMPKTRSTSSSGCEGTRRPCR